MLFFVLQFAVAVTYASDNFVIAQIQGPDAVTQYSIPARLFAIAPMIVGMFLGPLWPAYGESVARGDQLWARQTLRKSIKASLALTALPAILLFAFAPLVLQWWIGEVMEPETALLAGLATWMVISTVGNAFAMFLNGTGVVGFQVVTAIVTAFASLALKIHLTERIGVSGVVWATVLTYSVFTLVPTLLFLPRYFARVSSEHLRRNTEELL
jgi:O-antigen/teichoic acid export membrane protein